VAPAVLNAANELAVALFLKEKIRFVDIPVWIEQALDKFAGPVKPSLEALVEADASVRRWITELNRVGAH
jgi:1-deoxy-D-xylulose-5-phosphate reductoisomerase